LLFCQLGEGENDQEDHWVQGAIDDLDMATRLGHLIQDSFRLAVMGAEL
jgi:hypothetical protein